MRIAASPARICNFTFWPGPGPRTLDLGAWGQAGIQICYEIVFSGEVVDRGDRPDYIFNPSNDGWFGSWGRGLGGGSGLRGGVFPFRAGLLAPRLTGSLAFGILGAVLGHGIAPSCVFGSPSSTCRA